MSFQIHALSADQFDHLFSMTDVELAARNARREIVASNPGSPCRVSLKDAEVGEEVILVHYEHQSEDTPYRAGHAIFIRQGVQQALPGRGKVPELFRPRLMSVRGFNSKHLMIDAEVVQGIELERVIGVMPAVFQTASGQMVCRTNDHREAVIFLVVASQ